MTSLDAITLVSYLKIMWATALIVGWSWMLVKFIRYKIRMRQMIAFKKQATEEWETQMDVFFKQFEEKDRRSYEKMGIPYRHHACPRFSDCRYQKMCKSWKKDD